MKPQPQRGYNADANTDAVAAGFLRLWVKENWEEAHEAEPARLWLPRERGEEPKAQSEPEQGAAAEGKEARYEGEEKEGGDVGPGAASPPDGESHEAKAEVEAEAGAGGGEGREKGGEEQRLGAAVEVRKAADRRHRVSRHTFTLEQLRELEGVFHRTPYLSVALRQSIDSRDMVQFAGRLTSPCSSGARGGAAFSGARGESWRRRRIWSKTPMDPLTPSLFVREDGSSMSFYVRPSPAKRRLSTLILQGGGTRCRVQEPGAVLLAQPGEAAAEASGDFISTQYILDCVERNEKLELEAYRLGPAPVADQAPETKPAVQARGAAAAAVAEPEPQSPAGRMVFTDADDVAILTYVKEHARSASSVTGNALWKAMEKSSLTQHSWQSMKDRYLKRLRGQEHKYLRGRPREPLLAETQEEG
ncbi:hypothetical protein MJG53_020050 [Ovis ammon polii x Ovis aries]|uniref:Telomeric repeat-binding factor 2-interacting protein 1 n=2 Tax=Ovis TaxID=9935 RepID=A0A835ZLA9_SHEEP|nr:hypothetical protein JEQ12_020393 [Ovis aries]KAI4554751.1 hypothetical protein MJG53_020050 [Ovis ammon polii x Ovis aries]